METGKDSKAAIFKSSLHKVTKAHNYFFCDCFLIFFMIRTLTDDFWGLHRNKNCAFTVYEKNVSPR